MNATWVGVFAKGNNRKYATLRFDNQEWAVISYIIRVTCEMYEIQGWFLESYELTGDVENERQNSRGAGRTHC